MVVVKVIVVNPRLVVLIETTSKLPISKLPVSRCGIVAFILDRAFPVP